MVDRWLRTVPPGPVLDVGSAGGRFDSLILTAGHPLISLDIDRAALGPNAGSARPRRAQRVRGDAHRLPVRTASLAGALAIRLFHRFEDPEPLIREVRRALRPDGAFLLSYVRGPSLRTLAWDVTHFLRRDHSQRLGLTVDRRTAVRFAPHPAWIEGPRPFEARVRRDGFEVQERTGTGFEAMALLHRLPPRLWSRVGPVAGRLPGSPTVFLGCHRSIEAPGDRPATSPRRLNGGTG